MHILYFHQHFSTPAGSAGIRSYEMSRAAIAKGHKVTMVCGSYGGGITGLSGEPVRGIRRGCVDDIDVIEICLPYSNYDSLLKRTGTFLRFALKSISIARKTKYDLLFATSTPLTAGIPGIAMRLLKPKKPSVFEVRDLWPELPREMKVVTNPLILWGMSILEWLSYWSANACIGLSPGIVKGIKQRCKSEKNVVMIPNGCDLQLFRPAPIKTVTDKSLKAVFTGAHGMANGLHAVLDAAAVLMQRNREDIELIFIGDGKLKPELVARAESEGLSNCSFHDPVPKTTLAKSMQDFDVGMMILDDIPAFYFGTSPNKFFDYIASGLPILNNYPGWLAGMIDDAQCGKVVTPGDPHAFADALEEFASSPEQRVTMGENARQLAEEQFSRSMLADQFVRTLEDVFARHKAS